jgi:hypothetical protein
MKTKIFFSTIFVCFLSFSVFAQNEMTTLQPTISEAELLQINENLPPHLKIDNTGRIQQNYSRSQVYLLDSTHWFDWDNFTASWTIVSKDYNTIYDVNGNLLESETYELDSTGNFQLHSRQEWTYDLNGRTNIVYGFNKNGMSWDSSFIVNYEFNNDGYITFYERYNYDVVTGLRVPSYKYERTYNIHNHLTRSLQFRGTGNMWRTLRDNEYTYDVNTNLIEAFRYYNQDITTGQWVFITKDSIFYDSNGQRNLSQKHELDTMNNTWSLTTQSLLTTNSDGYYIELINQTWISSQTWQNTSKQTYTFNNDNAETYFFNEIWDTVNTTWTPSYKRESNYSGFNKIDLINAFNWINGAWQINYKHVYQYDNNENPIRFEYWTFALSSNGLIGFEAYDAFYSLHNVTNTISIKNEPIKAYPNPTTGSVNIELPKNITPGLVRIWDTQGRLVHQMNYQQNQIDISSLENGVYWLQFINDDYSETLKIIKQ